MYSFKGLARRERGGLSAALPFWPFKIPKSACCLGRAACGRERPSRRGAVWKRCVWLGVASSRGPLCVGFQPRHFGSAAGPRTSRGRVRAGGQSEWAGCCGAACERRRGHPGASGVGAGRARGPTRPGPLGAWRGGRSRAKPVTSETSARVRPLSRRGPPDPSPSGPQHSAPRARLCRVAPADARGSREPCGGLGTTAGRRAGCRPAPPGLGPAPATAR